MADSWSALETSDADTKALDLAKKVKLFLNRDNGERARTLRTVLEFSGQVRVDTWGELAVALDSLAKDVAHFQTRVFRVMARRAEQIGEREDA
jgi:hypothetical protein